MIPAEFESALDQAFAFIDAAEIVQDERAVEKRIDMTGR